MNNMVLELEGQNVSTFEEISVVQKPSTPNDDDFDDELGYPHTLTIISFEGMPVVVERQDEGDAAILPENDKIAFNAVHKRSVKFKSFQRNVFIPGVDIQVAISDNERNLTTHFLNPNLYTISLTHGNFKWEIKKRYKHIQHLHQQLILFRTSLNIPFPTKTHRERRDTFKNNAVRSKRGKLKGALPRFPKKPEVLIPIEQLPNRIKQLEAYLNNLLSISIYRNHPETIRFLEISHLSFVHELGIKGKEGMVKKRSGNSGYCSCNCCGCSYSSFCIRCRQCYRDIICSSWGERWFFIKDQCFGYVDPRTGRLGSVILFDQGFEVGSGLYSTGLQTGIQILTLNRQIVIKCWTRRKAKEWMQSLKDVAHNEAKDFTQTNPRHSFAPIRNNIVASWFVDGAAYMSAIADAIEAAKEEVFIADWWLSPEIYLKRPAINGDHWRLDKLLQRKAKQGIKIFVLLYKEVEMALGLNSYYSKQRLIQDSDDNIKVLRHPDHAKVGVFLWAHHEKIVVVDQMFAFLGGIDLCYGRWDDFKHRLTDLGSMTPTIELSALKKKSSSVPFGETNPTPYYAKVEPPQTIIETASTEPTTPVPQNSVNFLIPNGQFVEYIKGNTPEMERKTLLTSLKKGIKNKGKDMMKMMHSSHELDDNSNKNSLELSLQTTEELVNSLDGSAKFWVGKDYVNFIVKDFTNLDAPFDDFIDRIKTPRMPWHDVGVCVQNAAARDVARHFIQRWNATKLEKVKFNSIYPYLLPKSYIDCNKGTFSSMETHKVTCQVLRSVSAWSCGFLEADTVEQSIHEAYIDTIARSQHFIYIENQFFISLPHSNLNTKNQVAEALYNRIRRAHKEKAVFRVFVVMPLLPGFEGEVGAPSGTSLHAITHWNYVSISCGKDALLNRLKAGGIDDPSEYITFCGLRTHALLKNEPITELIYVHSKLMIVDDKIVICGSANINDRSLIGKRDSEIAVIIEDEAFEDGVMNGDHFPSGLFAGSLRKRLFKEHLGLLGKESETNIDLTDPISEYFYKDVWYNIAKLNTELYEKIFHCIPSDKVESFSGLKKYQDEKPLYMDEESGTENMLENIKGYLVLLPLNFLSKETLTPTAGTVEGMMPTSLWT